MKKEEIPSFTIFRPASFAQKQWIQTLSRVLTEKTEHDYADIKRVLKPLSLALQATIIGEYELRRMHRQFRIRPNVEDIHALGSHVMSSINTANSEVERMPVLPVRTPRYGKRVSVVVASGEPAITERTSAIQAIKEFYELKGWPGDVWDDNNYAAGLTVARGRNPVQNKIASYANVIIQSEVRSGGLPSAVDLGGLYLDHN